MEAHRFGGLHSYVSPDEPPDNFIFEPKKPITLFEGWNGSGKTSLLNAIIWCLTGQILRPQRSPEGADEEFECRIEREAPETESFHRLTPVTPLPNPKQFLPNITDTKLPIDTWVELTFSDESSGELQTIRRSQRRDNKGKLIEETPDLSALNLDPITPYIGTTIPGLIPFIQIGSESELGKAVTKLTGLSELVNLSKHATQTV